MNVDNFNNFGIFLLMGIEVFFMYKYAKYWLQLLAILKDEENPGLSFYSQKELNDAGAKFDFKRGYGMIFSNIGVGAKIVFSLKTDNPKISVLVKGIRRTLFLAILTPMIFAFVLIFGTALMQ
jgi:hypothetical protein